MLISVRVQPYALQNISWQAAQAGPLHGQHSRKVRHFYLIHYKQVTNAMLKFALQFLD